MNPETMSHEEIRKMEISRAKSDEELMDLGAKHTKKVAEYGPRLDISEGRHDIPEMLQLGGEQSLETIRNLEGKEYAADFASLQADIKAKEVLFDRARRMLRSDRKAFQEFSMAVGHDGDGEVSPGEVSRLVETMRTDTISPVDWESALRSVRIAKSFAEKYHLQVPMFDMDDDLLITGVNADALTTAIEQARLQVLYSAKEYLGKVH